MKRRYLNRSLLSLLMLGGALILAVSGMTLYLAPHGQGWSWRFLGLIKREWRSIHVFFAFAFIGLSLLHLTVNGKPFVSYLRQRVFLNGAETFRFRIEPLIAFFLCALLVAAALYG